VVCKTVEVAGFKSLSRQNKNRDKKLCGLILYCNSKKLISIGFAVLRNEIDSNVYYFFSKNKPRLGFRLIWSRNKFLGCPYRPRVMKARL